ncbi:MAG TPA: hypothetical protein VFY99_01400 [Solirubrobacterales bacterium]
MVDDLALAERRARGTAAVGVGEGGRVDAGRVVLGGLGAGDLLVEPLVGDDLVQDRERRRSGRGATDQLPAAEALPSPPAVAGRFFVLARHRFRRV